MEKYLLALDNSSYLEKILKYVARQLGGKKDVELIIFHIQQPCITIDEFLEKDFDRDLLIQKIEELKRNKRLCKESRAQVWEQIKEKARRFLTEAGIEESQIQFVVVEESGDYATLILEKAKEYGCNTIVLGKKGDSIISEYLIGSTAEKVSRISKGFAIWLID